ncbi:MAG: EAL domain-containing protein, partial [Syntrophobacteraceae bacterium]|nr:EAL domain-containing protein [Syntrophobacteraceae bacterium]
ELTPRTGSFATSDQVRAICGMNSHDGKRSWEDFLASVHPEDQAPLRSLMQNALRMGKSQFMDHRVLLPDFSERIVSHQIEVELDEGGEVLRLYGTVQDITERKRTELFEADRNRILQSIIQNQGLPDILHEVVKVVENQSPGSVGCLCLVQEDQIKVFAAPGLSESFVQSLNNLTVGPESGCCGSAAYLGQPVIAPDISCNPFWLGCLDAAREEGICSSFSVPILSGKGRTLGTISLFRGKIHHATDEEIKLTEKMAQLAAIAIEQCQLSELLLHQAKHDALTGLLNRSALAQLLGYRLNGRRGNSSRAALLLVDLDRFKRINDSLGHEIGDLLLCQVSERLRECVRKNDLLGRIGGDEFLVALYPIHTAADARKAADRILKSLTRPFNIQGHQLHIGASIGISMFPDDGPDTAIVQKNADIAMYVAKNEGGNCFQFFNPEMNASLIERLQIENDLRKGIERNEFELHYQPQYDLRSGKLAALEALIRWNHPEHGRLAPDRFIPVAEESLLIIPIGSWVIREACRQSAQWVTQGYAPVRIAVNVSAMQFTQPDFAQIVARALKDNNLDPKYLEVEITETVILKDKEEVRKNLAALKKMGVMTTIDDFGTGYSSVTYLRQMPLDCLKIDKSFIKELFGDDASALRTKNLVKAFVALAKNLNLTLVAEGIENPDQCEFVSMIGCELGQGFLFSAPLPAREIMSVLQECRTNPCDSHQKLDPPSLQQTEAAC